jgi:hypothetical protein
VTLPSSSDPVANAPAVTVGCSPGEVAIGGSWRTDYGVDLIVNASYPGTPASTPGSNAGSWTFRAYASIGSPTVTFYAICVVVG